MNDFSGRDFLKDSGAGLAGLSLAGFRKRFSGG